MVFGCSGYAGKEHLLTGGAGTMSMARAARKVQWPRVSTGVTVIQDRLQNERNLYRPYRPYAVNMLLEDPLN
jgi:hypothetical protein